MKISPHRLSCLAFYAFFLFAGISDSWATVSQVVLNLEGNPTCSSLSANSQVLEAKDTSPPTTLGTYDEATGPDGQKIRYNLGPSSRNSVDGWNISSPAAPYPPSVKPINFVILKAQGSAGARVFYYSGQGVLSDGTLTATGTITSVSFCYGLTTYTPPPSANLPDCNELPPTSLGIGALDDTGIQCPSSSDERVLISLDPNAPNWNVTACSCNHTFRACDPNVPAGSPGACTTVGDTLEHVPVIIEAIEDPTYCTTSGGTRTCKTY